MSDDFEHLTPELTRNLSAVLDELIPPSADGRLPGAGALGLASAIEEKMREQPDLRPLGEVVGHLQAGAELEHAAEVLAVAVFVERDGELRRHHPASGLQVEAQAAVDPDVAVVGTDPDDALLHG